MLWGLAWFLVGVGVCISWYRLVVVILLPGVHAWLGWVGGWVIFMFMALVQTWHWLLGITILLVSVHAWLGLVVCMHQDGVHAWQG